MKNLYAAVVLAIIVFFLSSCKGETVDVNSRPLYSEETVTEISQSFVPEQSTYIDEEPESIDYLAEAGISIVEKTDAKIFARKKLWEDQMIHIKASRDVEYDFHMLSDNHERVTITYYSEILPIEVVYDGAINALKSFSYAGKVLYETDLDNIEEDGQFHVYIDGEKAMISYAVVNEWTGQDRRLWLCFGDDIYEVDAYYTCGTSLKNGRFEYRKILDNYDDDMFDTPWWNDDFDTFYGFFYNSDDEDAPDPDAPYYEVGEIICEDGDIKYLKEGTKTMREHYNELSVWYK